jgi:outer membrane protein TolC
VTLIAAQSDVRNGRTLLAFLIDAPVDDTPLDDGLLIPQPLPSLEAVLEDADSGREDLAAARAGIAAARQGVESAVGQYYPSVTLNLNAYLSRQSAPTDSVWNGLLSANLPIFTGGVIHANVRTAWSRLRQALLDESLTRRQVEQDIRVAYENLLTSQRRLDELNTQLEAAQEALRQAEASYNAGLGTNLERVTAQVQLLSAQLDIASETFDQKVFYLDLRRAAGRLEAAVENPEVPGIAVPPGAPTTTRTP